MTKETAKEYLPLVQALAEGKLQQRKVIDGVWVDAWMDCEGTNFDQPSRFYRVKPEPRRFWLVDMREDWWKVCHNKESAIYFSKSWEHPIVEVVEVIKP